VAAPWSCIVEPPTASGTPVDCTLAGTLDPGSAPTFTLSATVGSGLYPSFVNTATVAATTADPDSTNNTSALTVTVPPQVLLSVTKTHAGTLVSGSNVKYVITVTNSGTTPQPTGYTITDPLPTGLTYVSWSGTDVGCTVAGSIVTCVFTAPLAIGAMSLVTLTTHVDAASPAMIVNTATAGTTSEQLSTANITASDPGAVAAAPKKVLGYTGVEIMAPLYLSLLALILGLGLVVVQRLRRRTSAQ
jgi:large repetitive protein